MKTFLLIVLVFFSVHAKSQIEVSASSGLSSFGSGDLIGHALGFGVNKQLKKRVAVQATLRSDVGSREIPLTFTDPDGTFWNSSFRYVTSGTQLELSGSFAPIVTQIYRFELGAGAVIRHQTSNYYSDVLFIYPIVTGYPVPLISLYARDGGKYRRFSVGYLLKISNSFNVSQKSNIGFSIQLQNDDKGDLIWNIPFNYSYRLSKK